MLFRVLFCLCAAGSPLSGLPANTNLRAACSFSRLCKPPFCHSNLIRMAGGGSGGVEKIYSVLADAPASVGSIIVKEKGSSWAVGLKSLLLFSLGFDSSEFKELAKEASSQGACTYVISSYGILGYSPEANRNLELMEKGRGQEYGCVGGDGGAGVVAALFYGDEFVPSTSELPKDAASHMVVCTDSSKVIPLLEQHGTSFYYGGVAKEIHSYNGADQKFVRTPHVFLSSLRGDIACIATSITGDVKSAVSELLASIPPPLTVRSVAMFPCFTRGKNMYGKNDVEPAAVSETLPATRLFGMFAHGELGPASPVNFQARAMPKDCCEHSETTVLALFASKAS